HPTRPARSISPCCTFSLRASGPTRRCSARCAVGGHTCVVRRRIEALVAEQSLDHPNIELALEQVGGKAVPQGVQRGTLPDVGSLSCQMEDAIELPVRQRVDRRSAWKQPTLGLRRLPPLPQHFKQGRRQHHIAILAALPCSMRITIWVLSMSET